MTKTLFIGGISWGTTEDTLRAHLSSVAPILSVKIPRERDTDRSRGIAFVDVESEEDMERIIDEFNGKEFEGRTLNINEARPREERPQRREPTHRGR